MGLSEEKTYHSDEHNLWYSKQKVKEHKEIKNPLGRSAHLVLFIS